MGDFNLIYRACDKSNSRVNRRLILASWVVLEDLEIKELQLHGRCFTWSSGTTNPTLSNEHVFVSKEWELSNPHCYLQALSSSVSDHCPLLFICTPFAKRYKGFRFEAS
jgi:endonuclease/exonuclease/phosphatase family metal-dependent hydrolase